MDTGSERDGHDGRDDLARQELAREVRRAKRIAGEQAALLHDLVEERLPAAYAEIPALAQAVYAACKHWADVSARLAEQ